MSSSRRWDTALGRVAGATVPETDDVLQCGENLRPEDCPPRVEIVVSGTALPRTPSARPFGQKWWSSETPSSFLRRLGAQRVMSRCALTVFACARGLRQRHPGAHHDPALAGTAADSTWAIASGISPIRTTRGRRSELRSMLESAVGLPARRN